MSRRFLTGSVLAAVAAVAASAVAIAGPPPTVVYVKDSKFKPDLASQLLDEEASTIWSWRPSVERRHNVRQDSKLFYSGSPTDDPKFAYSTRASAGTYHYFCEVHGSKNGGMDGVLKVKPRSQLVDTALYTIYWAEHEDTGDQFDVRYRVNKRKFKPWLTDTTLPSADFGGGNPVNVIGGKTYTFQARSEDSTNPDRRSGWSPKLVVKP